LMAAAGLDAQLGVIAGGLYAGIKVNAPKGASLPAACRASTLRYAASVNERG
jgi:hypothetical protein